MIDISRAVRILIDYNQMLAFRGDFSLIHSWVNQGCDLDKDIIPAIQEVTKKKEGITSISYFAPVVFKKRDNRIEVERAISLVGNQGELPKTPEEQKYKNILFKKKFYHYINTDDEKFIKYYEEKHTVNV